MNGATPAMLVGSIALGTAALDAAMLSEVTGLPVADAHHWSLDEVLWDPDALAAAAAPLGDGGGGGGGALRPAPLAAAAPKPKATPRRRTQQGASCQALGCSEALNALGAYYMRNRLCPAHLRAEQLWLAQEGPPLRFCQVRCRRTPGNSRPHTLPLRVLGTYALPFITPARRSATGATMLPPSTA